MEEERPTVEPLGPRCMGEGSLPWRVFLAGWCARPLKPLRRSQVCVDGHEAAARIAYKLNEIIAIHRRAERQLVRGTTRVSPEGPLGSYYMTFDRPSSFIGGSAMNEGMIAALTPFDRLNEGAR